MAAIYNKQRLFLVEVTWLIWKLVLHIYEIINMLTPKNFLWYIKEPEGAEVDVGHAEKTEPRNLFIS